jgi:hypothetical protein
MILAANQAAGRLAGGGVDIPIGRIVIAFIFCVMIAFLAILLLRQRMGQGGVPGWLRQVAPGRGAIEIVEVRRMSVHADIGLVRHGGREYLLILQAGGNRILSEGDLPLDEETAA